MRCPSGTGTFIYLGVAVCVVHSIHPRRVPPHVLCNVNADARAAKVYPIGIPVLYAYILWKNRDALNPSVRATVAPDPNDTEEEDPEGDAGGPSTNHSLLLRSGTFRRSRSATAMSSEAFHELEEKIRKRGEHPDLVPSMFLWKDFGEGEKRYSITRVRQSLHLLIPV